MKRKKGERKDESGKGEEKIFRKSRKTGRSSVKGGEKGESVIEELRRRWKKEMEEVIREMRGVREGIKEQRVEEGNGENEEGIA